MYNVSVQRTETPRGFDPSSQAPTFNFFAIHIYCSHHHHHLLLLLLLSPPFFLPHSSSCSGLIPGSHASRLASLPPSPPLISIKSLLSKTCNVRFRSTASRLHIPNFQISLIEVVPFLQACRTSIHSFLQRDIPRIRIGRPALRLGCCSSCRKLSPRPSHGKADSSLRPGRIDLEYRSRLRHAL